MRLQGVTFPVDENKPRCPVCEGFDLHVETCHNEEDDHRRRRYTCGRCKSIGPWRPDSYTLEELHREWMRRFGR